MRIIALCLIAGFSGEIMSVNDKYQGGSSEAMGKYGGWNFIRMDRFFRIELSI